jgi:vacuolar-type H+-ATPase subunit H
MSTEEMTSNIETIEIEAERILEEARSKANEILLKANEEANKILSSDLPMDEVKAECQKIIHKAREEADKKIEDSRKEASEIKTGTGKKVDKITERIVSNITGAELG